MQHLPHHRHHALHLTARNAARHPETGHIMERRASGSPSSGPSTQTMTILLGVLIPCTIAAVIFIVLHRRHVKRLRKEDADDKHKSLDFGLGNTKRPAGRTRPEMSGPDGGKQSAHKQGLSIDIGTPYLLPPTLHGSRDSLHSLSRNLHQAEDPYRPATSYHPGDSHSVRSYTVRDFDEASSYNGSVAGTRDGMNHSLLKNAAQTSRSSPPLPASPGAPLFEAPGTPLISVKSPTSPGPARKDSLPAVSKTNLMSPSAGGRGQTDSYINKDSGDMRRSNQYLGALIDDSSSPTVSGSDTPGAQLAREQPKLQSVPEPVKNKVTPIVAQQASYEGGRTEPPRSMVASLVSHASTNYLDESVSREHDMNRFPLPPQKMSDPTSGQIDKRSSAAPPAANMRHPAAGHLQAPGHDFDIRRLSMGFRPLPPEDPTDNPEQRANRIRSFYKEYFDDSKPHPAREQAAAQYAEAYEQARSGDTVFHDPTTGEFISTRPPFAEPVPRRAMTPPPRAPPRYGSEQRQYPPINRLASPPAGGPRSYSSASGMVPSSQRRALPQQRLAPPPGPLRTLPTPHLVKEDSFTLAIDFAPPATFKDRQAGRPESPLGELRPYSPSLPAFLPLASSFDDLAVLPSPHALRKSGTFTALDFVPPPRLRVNDAGSDATSIRSGRSGGSSVSAVQLQSIRAGAYRVSRLPKEVVGTKADFTTSLRPNWDLKT